jgi:hypothetical protein
MRSKMGKVFPKMGKVLHPGDGAADSEVDYATAIAVALRQNLGTTHRAIKSAMRWTGASERTVKYWFAGTSGPSGEHLITLARHSDAVLNVFLRRAERERHASALRLMDARDKLGEMLDLIQALIHDNIDPQ